MKLSSSIVYGTNWMNLFVEDTSGYKTHQLHGTSSSHLIFISSTPQPRDYQITSQRSGTLYI